MGRETRDRLSALGEDLEGTDWHAHALAQREELVECIRLSSSTDHAAEMRRAAEAMAREAAYSNTGGARVDG